MSTYREAILHARRGGTARLSGKEIRFLTFEEAEPIILEQCPSRATRVGENGKAVVENGQIVVDTFAASTFDTKRLGLYDVGVHPAVPLQAIDEDIYEPLELDENGNEKPRVLRTDWAIAEAPAEEPLDEEPAVVEPDVVDEVLNETVPETLGTLDAHTDE